MTGQATGNKAINLSQLQGELQAGGGVTVANGLGMVGDMVYTFNADGTIADFETAQQAMVDAAIAAHVALRDKSDAEYSTEFQDAGTSAARKQNIRDITAGLLPREQVPM